MDELTKSVAASTGPIQAQATQDPSTVRGNGHGLPPIPKELFVIDTRWQRKNISFRQWCLTGCINHASGQGPCPGVVGRHKRNSMVFLYEYCFIWAFFLISLLFVYFNVCFSGGCFEFRLFGLFWFVWFVYFFLKRKKKEHSTGWIQR